MEAAAAIAAIILSKRRRRREEKKRRIWVREWIRKREVCGVLDNLLLELRVGDEKFYQNFLRMAANDFDALLQKVSPLIKKKNTVMRDSISPTERLAVTLRYLATGDSYKSLMYLFRIPVNTISRIIPEVCQAIYDVLKDEFLKMPETEEEWMAIADGFEKNWNFPNCIGALDGKHVNIRAPPNTGSLFYNYKRSYSIILLALADADYKFTYINVGAPGRDSDGGVFSNSSLSRSLNDNTLNLPPGRVLPGRNKQVPFVVVADDAFALKPHIMKPFSAKNLSVPERIFNYRLSRARRIVENVFGLISVRFRILRNIIELSDDKVIKILCAVCALHNFLITRNSKTVYASPGMFDTENQDGSIRPGAWRNVGVELPQLQRDNGRNSSISSKVIRDEFKDYFCREGEVPWQCH